MSLALPQIPIQIPAIKRQLGSTVSHSQDWCEANEKIVLSRGGLPVPLRYNYVQLQLERIYRMLEALGIPVRLIILKARQLGVSTWVESLIYDLAVHNPYTSSLITAHDTDGSNHLYGMFKTFYANDPEPIETARSHQKGLIFAKPHGSEVLVQTAGKTFAGTSLTIQALHLSEISKWPDPQTTFLSIMGGFHEMTNTVGIVESTAAGVGDWFNEFWDEAIDRLRRALGRGERVSRGWLPCFFPWYCHPDYRMNPNHVEMEQIGEHPDYNLNPGEETRLLELTEAHIGIDTVPVGIDLAQLAWRRWAIDNKCGGEVLLLHQEHPATPRQAFISGGHPRFNVAIMEEMLYTCCDPVDVGSFEILEGMTPMRPELLPPDEDGVTIQIWKWPVDGHHYVVGADSKGSDVSSSSDHHSGCVLDIDTTEIVATIWGDWDADTYASHLVQSCKMYNSALLSIEVNGVGEAVQNRAVRLYHHFYHRVPVDEEFVKPGRKIGWWTGVNRPRLIGTMARAIRMREIKCWDEEMILEWMSFHRVPGIREAEHMPSTHDDRVFSPMIALETSSYTAMSQIKEYDKAVHQQSTGTNMSKFGR